MKLISPLLISALAFVVAPTMSQGTPSNTTRYPTLGGIGIGVTNMTASAKWYIDVLGMKDTGTRYYTAQFDEIVLSMPQPRTGSSLVLMQWKTPKNVTNQAVKLAYFVESVKGTIEKCRKTGVRIVLEPGSGKVGNTTIPTGMATDPDGYLLEFNPLSSLPKLP